MIEIRTRDRNGEFNGAYIFTASHIQLPPSFKSIDRARLEAVRHLTKPFLQRRRCGPRARCRSCSCCSAAGWARLRRRRRRRPGISWTTAAACWDASHAARISGSASRARMMVPGFCQRANAVSQSIDDCRWPSRIIIIIIACIITWLAGMVLVGAHADSS